MIFDIVSTQAGAGSLDFVAAVAPPTSIPITGAGAGVVFGSSDIPTKQWFEPGDNLKINSLEIAIPYGFGIGFGQTSLRFVFRDSAGVGILIPEFATNGWITYPNICNRLDFPGDGLFISVPKNQGRFRLWLINFVAEVSMVNVPSVLIGQTVQLQVHASITHTLPMASVP